MSDISKSFTKEQQAAVKHRGGSLLVSAAAGSGKTRVLVERLLDRIENGDNIDEFLIITFTRAAAAELRGRILDEISVRLEDDPENRNLRRQSMLCRGASIDTIHGFCTDILRENAHLAGLPPDFRIIDESESEIIKAEVLEEVLEKAYETIETSSDFRELIDMMSGGRDDRRVASMILDAHAKLQSNPDPRGWAEKQGRQMTMPGVTDVSETVWGAQLMSKARNTALFWHGEMVRFRDDIRALPQFDNSYGASIDATINGIEAFLAALDKGWDEAGSKSAIEFPRPKPISGYDRLKDIRKRCKTAMDKCASAFECTSKQHIEDMLAVAPAMTALLRLALDFDNAYAEDKRRRGTADFSDLEHSALSLLIDGTTGAKTGLARAISKRYKEIMVDEYQDVNAVQEYIFNAVSKDGNNIFMVGDVKQSIYRFRLADPSIFLAKYKSFKDAGGSGGESGKEKILLSKNFRSRAGILNAVNYIFGSIMSVDFGEMDYTEREQLIPGRTEEDDDAEPAAEFNIIDMSGTDNGEGEDSPVREQAEAGYIARRIIELTSGSYLIPDGQGGKRGVKYSDIAILLRSTRNKAWRYAKALADYGVPADLPGSEGYFETAEVSAALSLLTVIDNPMQDIPLAAALRGPVCKFTADELAEIRASSRNTDFYSALVKAAKSNVKCAAFLKEIEALRVVMPDMPADRFIWHVYNKTGLLGWVSAMRGGEKRRNNLVLLTEYARRFEQNGYKGLFGFLTYLCGLQERGAELARESAEPVSDCVRIMSIHKSKGLEFPIVFLADTSKRVNNRDAQQPLVIHQALGIGAVRIDRQRRIEYPTLARLAVQSKLTSEMMAEELRVMYVAMTRAREKLIITAVFKDASNEIDKLSKLSGGQLSPQALEETRSMAEWILLPLLRQFGVESGEERVESLERIEESGEWRDGRLFGNADITVRINKVEAPTDSVITHIPDPQFSAQLSARGDTLQEYVELLRERFSFAYPHERAPELPSKLTVTGLKGRLFDYEAAEDAAFFDGHAASTGAISPRQSFRRPGFIIKKEGLTAAERGTALHLAMQYIDYRKCGNADGVLNELKRLAREGIITGEQYETIEPLKITRFFDSDIGKRARQAIAVNREFKFSLLYPAERFYPGGGDDEILLQGVVDCFFEEGGELVLIDFKTDRASQDTIAEKADYYSPQLAAYSDALERITGKHVKERIVYFFSADAPFALPFAYASDQQKKLDD